MPSEDQIDHMSQQQQQRDTKTAANTNANPNSGITNELANVIKEKKKLVRRAFSMPRNLFRLSRRVKISNSATSTKISTGSDANSPTTPSDACNQSKQIDSNDQNKLNAENVENIKHRTLPVSSSSSDMSHLATKPNHFPEAKPEQDNKHRLFRRSTWKKFLFARFILQSINLKVISIILFCYFRRYFSVDSQMRQIVCLSPRRSLIYRSKISSSACGSPKIVTPRQ